eukprot:TRINITY_DN12354_c0_g1_i1.p1 TRINITY_DN12354_c0_g1~~TRINITY_DN12354_c0_g1_i1.p1  ORF type:complete len:422 (+),score=37.39 TRINITY_DN12354_c0_g1_i1:2099-3364(+)
MADDDDDYATILSVIKQMRQKSSPDLTVAADCCLHSEETLLRLEHDLEDDILSMPLQCSGVEVLTREQWRPVVTMMAEMALLQLWLRAGLFGTTTVLSVDIGPLDMSDELIELLFQKHAFTEIRIFYDGYLSSDVLNAIVLYRQQWLSTNIGCIIHVYEASKPINLRASILLPSKVVLQIPDDVRTPAVWDKILSFFDAPHHMFNDVVIGGNSAPSTNFSPLIRATDLASKANLTLAPGSQIECFHAWGNYCYVCRFDVGDCCFCIAIEIKNIHTLAQSARCTKLELVSPNEVLSPTLQEHAMYEDVQILELRFALRPRQPEDCFHFMNALLGNFPNILLAYSAAHKNRDKWPLKRLSVYLTICQHEVTLSSYATLLRDPHLRPMLRMLLDLNIAAAAGEAVLPAAVNAVLMQAVLITGLV